MGPWNTTNKTEAIKRNKKRCGQHRRSDKREQVLPLPTLEIPHIEVDNAGYWDLIDDIPLVLTSGVDSEDTALFFVKGGTLDTVVRFAAPADHVLQMLVASDPKEAAAVEGKLSCIWRTLDSLSKFVQRNTGSNTASIVESVGTQEYRRAVHRWTPANMSNLRRGTIVDFVNHCSAVWTSRKAIARDKISRFAVRIERRFDDWFATLKAPVHYNTLGHACRGLGGLAGVEDGWRAEIARSARAETYPGARQPFKHQVTPQPNGRRRVLTPGRD